MCDKRAGRLRILKGRLFFSSLQNVCSRQLCPTLLSYSLLSLACHSNFEGNEMSSENISSHSSLNDLKSLDFNDMVNVVSYFSMSLGEESMDN